MVTTPTKKARIVQLKALGLTDRDIANKENVNHSTVSRINARYAVTRDFYDKRPRSGRPRKIDTYNTRIALRMLANGTARDTTDLKRKQFPTISVDTVRRQLKRAGLNGRVRRKKPLLRRIHKVKRIQWAREFLGWDATDWRAVWFSDESKFNLFGSDGRQWCWRMPGEEFRDCNTQKTVKHGGGSVMVWGCITPYGVGRLHRIEGIMDAVKYVGILKSSLLGSLQDFGIKPQAIYFQQDNDPKHTSKLAKQFLASKHIDVLDWPPSSPDMNPIENAWNHLDCMIRLRDPLPTNIDQLWVVLQEEWGKLDQTYIDKLYASLPKRVQALKKVKGCATRY